jgi:heat shock protein HtpX
MRWPIRVYVSRYPRSGGLWFRMAACVLAVGAVYLLSVAWVSLFVLGWISAFAGALPSLFGAVAFVCAAVVLPIPLFPSLAQAAALRRLGAGAPTEEEAARLSPIVGRLAAMADVRPPEIAVIPSEAANAFSTSSLGGGVVAVTRGLLSRLTDEELEAVVAHELAHIANRDAFVMTLAVLPSVVARAVVFGVARAPFRHPALAVFALFLLMPFLLFLAFGWLTYAFIALFASALSRTRELAADHGAALVTGRPEALMSALQAVAGAARTIPAGDLRRSPALDALSFLPSERDAGSSLDPMRLFPTHPPLAARLERLAAIARRLGHGPGVIDARRELEAAVAARPANPRATIALALVLVLYGMSAWSVATFEHSDVVFSNELALAALACVAGGFVFGFQGVARASRGAAGMAYAATALVLLAIAPVAAFAVTVAVASG